MPLTLLIASDTHGRADLLQRALERTGADLLLFLGDGLRDLCAVPSDVTVRAVRGNCDWVSAPDAPTVRVETVAGTRIYMTHGHLHGVKLQLDTAMAAAVAAEADVLLYGHTHMPFERTLTRGTSLGGTVLQKDLLVLCPGSLGQPPDAHPSFATLTLTKSGPLAGFGKL